MRTLQESIIGRKGAYRKGIIPKSLDDLEYGDLIEISGQFGGVFLYVPQHVVNKIFVNEVNEDAFIEPSSYWRAGEFSISFPYNSRKSHRIEKIIGSVREDEYNNLETKNDLSRLFKKYNIPCE